MRGTELRVPFLINCLDSVTALLLNVIFFEIIYGHVQSIAGWGKYQVFMLLGVFMFEVAVLDMVVRPGISQLQYLIHRGDLDGYLTKPISSQFLITFGGFDLQRLFDVLLGLILMIYSLVKLGITPSPLQWLLAVMHIGLALVIIYAIWYISLTFVIWTTVLASWIYLVPNIFSFSKYPTSIYKGKLKMLFMTIIPVTVVVNYPASALLSKISWQSVFYSVILAVVFLGISIIFWKKSLRFYCSASS